MTLILESETDVAVISGESIHGPIRVHADSATVGATEYARGVVMVRDGEAVMLAQVSEAGIWAMYASILAGVMTGLWLSKAWAMRIIVFLGLSLPLAADYNMHVRTQTVINPTPEAQIKRVSIYPAVTTGGDTYYYAPEFTVTPTSSTNVGHSGSGTMRIGIQGRNAGNGAVGGVIDLGIVNYINSGSPLFSGYNFTYPETALPEGAVKFERKWKREEPFFQSSWNNHSTNINASSGMTEETTTRGALENHWQIEVAPHGVVQVHVERPYPFFLVIDDKRAYLNGDGNYFEEWVEESEDTSTDTTIESPESEGTPNSYTQAAPPQYSSGDDPEPVERPDNEALGTNVGMNAAAEARHTEEKGLLGQIRDGTDAGVNVASAAAGQAARDAAGIKGALDGIAAGDGEGVGDAGEGMGDAEGDAEAGGEAMRDGVMDSLSSLSDAIEDLAGSWNLGVSGAEYPVLTFTKPTMLGGGTLTMDFSAWSSMWQIMRGIILLACAWAFLRDTIDTVRGAFAG